MNTIGTPRSISVLSLLAAVLLGGSASGMSATSARVVFDHHPAAYYSGIPPHGSNELAIHPSNPQVMYRASEGSGVLKSTDGGVTWIPKIVGLPDLRVSFVRFHPNDPDHLYAGMRGHSWSTGGQVYRSFDAGETWQPTVICDGLGDEQNMNVGAWSQDLRVDPQNPSRAYYGAWVGDCRGWCGGFYRTVDDFATYEPNPSCVDAPEVERPFRGNDAGIIRIDPADSSVVHVASHLHTRYSALMTSFDYGLNFNYDHVINTYGSFLPETEWYISSLFTHSLDISPADPGVMYGDFGQEETRRRLDDRAIPTQWPDIDNLELYPRPVPILLRSDGTRGTSYVDGVGDNDEDGDDQPDVIWRPILNLVEAVPDVLTGSEAADLRNVGAIRAHLTDPNLVFFSTTARREDSELVFVVMVARPSDPADLNAQWDSQVLWRTETHLNGLIWFDRAPSDPDRIWILQKDGTTDYDFDEIVLLETTDHWNTWSATVLPQERQQNWATKIVVVDTPEGRRLFTSMSRDLLYSADGGVSWEPRSSPSTGGTIGVTSSPSEPDILYWIQARSILACMDSGDGSTLAPSNLSGMYLSVCTSVFTDLVADPTLPRAMWMTTDAGLYHHPGFNLDPQTPEDVLANNTWIRVASLDDPGLTDQYMWTLAIEPGNPLHQLYVGTRDGGIFHSADNGLSWVNPLPDVPDVRDIELHSPFSYAATAHGLFRSAQPGVTWEPTPLTSRTWDLSVDEVDPSTVYAAAQDGLYRSLDSGQTWHQLDMGGTVPFRSIQHTVFNGRPLLVFSGGGKGLSRAVSDLIVLAGEEPGSIRLKLATPVAPGTTGYLVYYGDTPSLEGTEADQGASPIRVSAPLNAALTGLSSDPVYVAVMELPLLQNSRTRGFTHRVNMSAADAPTCYASPDDPAMDADGDGVTFCNGDCDDADSNVFPGAQEQCGNGVDEDCDGADALCECIDADGDGYGVAGHNSACAVPLADDCDDANPDLAVPIACYFDGNDCGPVGVCDIVCPTPPDEICGNELDDDCDERVDERCGYVETLYAEDFEAYADQEDPEGWLDTGALSSLLEEDERFKVYDSAGNKTFGTAMSGLSTHSHYIGGMSEAWTNYEYSGRLQSIGTPSIGVTFFSDFPASATYYGVQRPLLAKRWQLVGVDGATCETGAVDATLELDAWYRFLVRVEDRGSGTQILAKIWPEGAPEPYWQLRCIDDSVGRRTRGRVGLLSTVFTSGQRLWDDIEVVSIYPSATQACLEQGAEVCPPPDVCEGDFIAATDTAYCCDDVCTAVKGPKSGKN